MGNTIDIKYAIFDKAATAAASENCAQKGTRIQEKHTFYMNELENSFSF